MTRLEAMEKVVEAARNFSSIKADDGDDFSCYDPSVVIRTEITAGELIELRASLIALDAIKMEENLDYGLERLKETDLGLTCPSCHTNFHSREIDEKLERGWKARGEWK